MAQATEDTVTRRLIEIDVELDEDAGEREAQREVDALRELLGDRGYPLVDVRVRTMRGAA